jgi:hypothetical protein
VALFLGGNMSGEGKILISFAWAIEIVGVTAGVFNSPYTTFGDDLPTTFAGYIPAVPMVALAVAEVGRVPLASVIFHRHKLTQLVAAIGILALGFLAVENWTFGFERIVNLRLKNVNAASAEVSRAEADLTSLRAQLNQQEVLNRAKRDELRLGLDRQDAAITSLTNQKGDEAAVHQKKLEDIRESCKIIRERCMVPFSQTESSRYEAVERRLNEELAARRSHKAALQTQIDDSVSKDAKESAQISQEIDAADKRFAEANKVSRAARNENQIHRLAASWYSVSVSDVTEEQFATARFVFSTFSAIAVAMIGSIAALVYYARNRPQGAPSLFGRLTAKLVRARRAYYARMRKPLKIDVPGPERVIYRDGKEPAQVIVKDKEVVRRIDRIVLIPRWGIKAPLYVNSLFGQRGSDDPAEAPSKVTQLKKAN